MRFHLRDTCLSSVGPLNFHCLAAKGAANFLLYRKSPEMAIDLITYHSCSFLQISTIIHVEIYHVFLIIKFDPKKLVSGHSEERGTLNRNNTSKPCPTTKISRKNRWYIVTGSSWNDPSHLRIENGEVIFVVGSLHDGFLWKGTLGYPATLNPFLHVFTYWNGHKMRYTLVYHTTAR